MIWKVILVSSRQLLVPDHLLGSVGGAFRLVGLLGGTIGALTGGLLARSYGLDAPFWLAGGLLLVVGLVSRVLLPEESFRRATR